MIRPKQRDKGIVYEAVLMYKGRKLSKSFDSHGEASRWINEQKYKRDQGQPTYTTKVTIQMLHDMFIKWAKEKRRSKGYLDNLEGQLKNHLLPWYEETNMTLVNDTEHQDFFNHLFDNEVGDVTRNRLRSHLHVLYSKAIEFKWFTGAFKINPITSIEPIEEIEQVVKYWTVEEKHQFLQANQKSHYYPFFVFLLGTGCRISEVLGLDGEQVNRETQTVIIDRQFNTAEGKVVMRTKGKRIRPIYLLQEVMKLLNPIPGVPLFQLPTGGRIPYDYFYKKVFKEACQSAKVRNIGPHGTRHTFATHYLMEGGSLWDLSKILGHSSTEVTEKRYAHFDVKQVRNRMRVIEQRENVIQAQFA